ncbi:protein translocase subunit SecF [Dethiosulfatarculus sandiegensis]|uniref:Protein-export membrane protein SecF n=1 Tax=Dethiosulfatarculus sandiegensis TaxID=1429043 RepID=A0A0D2G8Q8_9BACT|nr:protein translocase subunit SecF [Dethiosulfatarculus sandiegensis]KIX11307.1 preprotein translocase subunit SecF [Dethiosulfatarculus sandiegensis]
MEIIKPGINIDFVGRRKLAFGLSGLLLLVTIVSFLMHGGLNLGIDFAGGILVQVQFEKPTGPEEIKKILTPLGMGDSLVQRFGQEDKNEYLIRAEQQDLKLQGLADRVREALSKKYGKGFEVRRVDMVGPKVGADLRQKALMAIFFSLLFIAVYISGRFEAKWGIAAVMAAVLIGATLFVQTFVASGGVVALIITALVVTVGACWFLRLRYALGAIVALIHDVLITVGVFSLMDKEFTLATVAALLTIIGYSLNDTIIVYDRIRENLKKTGNKLLSGVINDSVNQTLSRTILTSTTTLVVLISLFVLGGGVIEDFAFALLVGVIIGTYSSVFVASPVLLLLPEGRAAKMPEANKAVKANNGEPAPAATANTASKAALSRKRSKKKASARRKRR